MDKHDYRQKRKQEKSAPIAMFLLVYPAPVSIDPKRLSSSISSISDDFSISKKRSLHDGITLALNDIIKHISLINKTSVRPLVVSNVSEFETILLAIYFQNMLAANWILSNIAVNICSLIREDAARKSDA